MRKSFLRYHWNFHKLNNYFQAIFLLRGRRVGGGRLVVSQKKCKNTSKTSKKTCNVGYTLIVKYVKMGAKCEKRKVYSGVFRATVFAVRAPFFALGISQHFMRGTKTFAV